MERKSIRGKARDEIGMREGRKRERPSQLSPSFYPVSLHPSLHYRGFLKGYFGILELVVTIVMSMCSV
jgi:hypothetical protein